MKITYKDKPYYGKFPYKLVSKEVENPMTVAEMNDALTAHDVKAKKDEFRVRKTEIWRRKIGDFVPGSTCYVKDEAVAKKLLDKYPDQICEFHGPADFKFDDGMAIATQILKKNLYRYTIFFTDGWSKDRSKWLGVKHHDIPAITAWCRSAGFLGPFEISRSKILLMNHQDVITFKMKYHEKVRNIENVNDADSITAYTQIIQSAQQAIDEINGDL